MTRFFILFSMTLLFSLPKNGFSSFGYDRDEKVIVSETNSLVFTKIGSGGSQSTKLLLKMEMVSFNNILWQPRISIETDLYSSIESLSLSFDTVTMSKIVNDIKESITLERDQPFPMIKTTQSFQAPFWGFRRTQHFLALYMKNNSMDINAKINGEDWKAQVSLKGSTISYIQYLWNVTRHQVRDAGRSELVSECLEPNADGGPYMKLPSAVFTSFACGLSKQGEIDTSLPGGLSSEILISLDPENYIESFRKAEKLFEIFEIKKNTLDGIDRLTNDKNFKKQSAQLVLVFEEMQYIWNHGVTPIVGGGDSSEGFLSQLKNREEQLHTELSQIEDSILRVSKEQVSPAQNEERLSALAYRNHAKVIYEFDKQIGSLFQQITQLNKDLDEFTKLLETYEDWLSSIPNNHRFESRAPLIAAEVRRTHIEQTSRHLRLKKLGSVHTELRKAITDIADLVTGAKSVADNYTKQLEFFANKSQLHERLKLANDNILQAEELFPTQIHDSVFELNDAIEIEISDLLPADQIRSGAFELDANRRLIRSHYDTLDNWVEKLFPGLRFAICNSAHYKSYKEKYKGSSHCLDPFDLLADVGKSEYFDSLSPKEVDTILSAFVDGALDPWNNQISKKAILKEHVIRGIEDAESRGLSFFSSNESLYSAILEEWSTIQFLRWRLRVNKSLARKDEGFVYTSEAYTPFISSTINNFYQILYPARDRLQTELLALQSITPKLLEEARGIKERYERDSNIFVETYIMPLAEKLRVINGLGEMPVLVDLSSCHFPIADLDQCENILIASLQSRDEVESYEKSHDLQTTYLMVQSLKGLIRSLNQSVRLTSQTHSEAISGKSSYVEENGLEELQEKRTAILLDLSQAQARLAELEERHSETKRTLLASEMDRFHYASRLSEFIRNIDKLKEKARSLSFDVKPICDQVYPGITEVKRLESELVVLLTGKKMASRYSNVVASCELPPISFFDMVQL